MHVNSQMFVTLDANMQLNELHFINHRLFTIHYPLVHCTLHILPISPMLTKMHRTHYASCASNECGHWNKTKLPKKTKTAKKLTKKATKNPNAKKKTWVMLYFIQLNPILITKRVSFARSQRSMFISLRFRGISYIFDLNVLCIGMNCHIQIFTSWYDAFLFIYSNKLHLKQFWYEILKDF